LIGSIRRPNCESPSIDAKTALIFLTQAELWPILSQILLPWQRGPRGFGVGWISRWPLWSTYRCAAWLQLTWPPTVSWSLAKVVVSCVLPTQGHVSSDGPTAAMILYALLLQVWGCGTIFQHIWDKLTLTLNSSSGCWRHFCLDVESAAHCS